MRQAYDYWQDQPGNFLVANATPPKRGPRGNNTRGSGLLRPHTPKRFYKLVSFFEFQEIRKRKFRASWRQRQPNVGDELKRTLFLWVSCTFPSSATIDKSRQRVTAILREESGTTRLSQGGALEQAVSHQNLKGAVRSQDVDARTCS